MNKKIVILIVSVFALVGILIGTWFLGRSSGKNEQEVPPPKVEDKPTVSTPQEETPIVEDSQTELETHVQINENTTVLYEPEDVTDLEYVSKVMEEKGLTGEYMELDVTPDALLSEFVLQYDIDKYWILYTDTEIYEVVKVGDEVFYAVAD